MTLEEHRQRIKSDWMDKVIYPPIVVSDKPLSYFSENNNKRKKKMLYSDYFTTVEYVSQGWLLPSKVLYHVERRSLKTLEIERVATFYRLYDAEDHEEFRNRKEARASEPGSSFQYLGGSMTSRLSWPVINY